MPANDIDTRITPSLHPSVMTKIEGYDETTKPYLATTESAFSTAYEGIRAMWETRAVVERYRGWSEEQRIVHLSKFAEKKFDQMAKGFDGARATLVKQIDHIEKELTTPVESKANTTIAVEIRAHVKNMPTEKLHGFIRGAVQSGDEITMTAILGAPGYLSGLNAEFQKQYLRQWRERTSPELAQRLKAMQGAKALIEKHSQVLFGEMEKVIGASLDRATQLRKDHDAATKALEM